VVYYYVHHTVDYQGNTGIQRVTRGLARAIEENGITPIYVKWNNPEQKFEPIDSNQMAHLGKWNGPRGPGKSFPAIPPREAWMVFPELPYFPGSFDFKVLIDKARSMGWRTAHVFYDVIPWKMKHLYPVAAVGEHQKYMQQLRMVDAVWSISHFSRAELRRFWREEGGMGEREESILGALPLPGEFLQSPRVTDAAPHPTGTGEPIRFLSVGTVEPRKNHLSLLQAWKIFRKRNPNLAAELLIVGGAPYPELEQQVRGLMAEAGGATWVKSPSDPEVRAAYAACDVTVYPSVEEGFGLPVLESLWYAKPSICHEGSSLRELGIGGGCCMVDMHDAAAIASAMERVVKDRAFRNTLLAETIRRPLKTWKFYGQEVLADMALRETLGAAPSPVPVAAPSDGKDILLSVCISTYNRSRWLRLGLAKVLVEFFPHMDQCEILVVDNTSTDDTPEVLGAFAQSFPIRVHRNEQNVGMLGNLAVTATLARGKHVWILGDDDFIADGIAPKILNILARHPALPLVYLNYAYSHGDLPGDLHEVKSFIQSGTPLVPVPQDVRDLTKNISVVNENFFTSIYALIFRKDHAVGAYTQDTSGRPFSNLVTCVPTTAYVISRMFDEMAYFVSQPALCVSLAVSWMRYAPLYHLERYPDMFQGALQHGAPPEGILALQEKLFPHGMGQLRLVYDADEEIRSQFSMERWILRHRHLHPFQNNLTEIRDIYGRAWAAGKVLADTKSPEIFFPQ
jgi:glycosyltransferase involved in cell wall biosynthesis